MSKLESVFNGFTNKQILVLGYALSQYIEDSTNTYNFISGTEADEARLLLNALSDYQDLKKKLDKLTEEMMIY
jgi:hypothetical protein